MLCRQRNYYWYLYPILDSAPCLLPLNLIPGIFCFSFSDKHEIPYLLRNIGGGNCRFRKVTSVFFESPGGSMRQLILYGKICKNSSHGWLNWVRLCEPKQWWLIQEIMIIQNSTLYEPGHWQGNNFTDLKVVSVFNVLFMAAKKYANPCV